MIYRLSEVETKTGLPRSSIYRLMEAGEFPKNVKLSQRAVGWHAEAIQNWIESRQPADAATSHQRQAA